MFRTTKLGESWEILPLPTQPNATVWGLATHPANANRIVTFSLFGEVYVTEDAGASWRKIVCEETQIDQVKAHGSFHERRLRLC
jgi:photosystem II stability/assembly factor-like uncharacterized protein